MTHLFLKISSSNNQKNKHFLVQYLALNKSQITGSFLQYKHVKMSRHSDE